MKTGKQYRKSTTNAGFCKINKLYLARLAKEKREKAWFTNIRNEREDSTTDPIDIKSCYSQQICAHKFDNLGGMYEFLKNVIYQNSRDRQSE